MKITAKRPKQIAFREVTEGMKRTIYIRILYPAMRAAVRLSKDYS